MPRPATDVRPLIGITTSLEGDEQRLDLRYVRAVERAGGLPLPVPILEDDGAADAFARLVDGLIVIGGPGITAGLEGELAPELAPVSERRGRSDQAILGHFLAADGPALGICYGMQLANALRGGTIWGDVERQLPGARVHSDRRAGAPHVARVLSGTHLRRILETDEVEVPTHHLQAVRSVGDGLAVAAVAPDGVIEAIESASGRFIGVQFHPERMDGRMDALFAHLVRIASTGR